jgi:hypothetical protein
MKAQALIKAKRKWEREIIDGSTPPSFFIGRAGYPKVYIGPMVPPEIGDTTIYAMPESWLSLGFEEIVSLRSMLVRGKKRVDVRRAKDPDSYLLNLQDAALSSRSVDSEMVLKRPPSAYLYLSDEAPPFGPSAPLKRVDFRPSSSEPKLEKVYYDRDLKAKEAVLLLYQRSLPVSKIVEVLSLGMLGRERKLVPTRWGITAVDSMISEGLLKRVKDYESIDEVLLYLHERMGNRYVILLVPGAWSFEWIEAWFPGTTWNPKGMDPEVMADHEGHRGRTTYPDIGGCYYASRLAVAELLNRMKRRATAILIREIYEDHLLPLGVWMVRESLREAFRKRPLRFSTLEEALMFAKAYLRVPLARYLKRSALLRRELRQKKLSDFAR